MYTDTMSNSEGFDLSFKVFHELMAQRVSRRQSQRAGLYLHPAQREPGLTEKFENVDILAAQILGAVHRRV